MAVLNFVKELNLTTSGNNVPPLFVKSLCVVNEPTNEIVQYYISKDTSQAEDKNAHLIDSDYDALRWGNKRRRLTARSVSRIGLKAFPGVGAIAYFRYLHENRSMILCPVNVNREDFEAPSLQMTETDTELTFTISSPDAIEYQCYRIVLRNENFAVEYVTYEKTLVVPKPSVKGTYEIYCIGYVNEGEKISYDSDIYHITVVDGASSFAPTSINLSAIEARLAALEREVEDYSDEEISTAVAEIIASGGTQ